jgi:hypothetical protein
MRLIPFEVRTLASSRAEGSSSQPQTAQFSKDPKFTPSSVMSPLRSNVKYPQQRHARSAIAETYVLRVYSGALAHTSSSRRTADPSGVKLAGVYSGSA